MNNKQIFLSALKFEATPRIPVDKLNVDLVENSREIQKLLNATRIMANEVGNEYIIGVSQWGPFTLAGLMFGLQNFMRICMRDTDAAHHILQNTSNLVLKYLNLFADAVQS